MLLFTVFLLIGSSSFLMGLIARILYDIEELRSGKILRFFRLNIIVPLSFFLLFMGILFELPLLNLYFKNKYELPDELSIETYHGVFGLCLSLLSFMLFTSSLVMHAAKSVILSRLNNK
jgi:hypothetical protein